MDETPKQKSAEQMLIDDGGDVDVNKEDQQMKGREENTEKVNSAAGKEAIDVDVLAEIVRVETKAVGNESNENKPSELSETKATEETQVKEIVKKELVSQVSPPVRAQNSN